MTLNELKHCLNKTVDRPEVPPDRSSELQPVVRSRLALDQSTWYAPTVR